MISLHPHKMWSKQQIKDLRLRLGWSVAEFSRRLGCDADRVMEWENGQREPASDDLTQMENLSFQVANYNMLIERQANADAFLNASAFEQIHRSQLSINEMTFDIEPTKTI